MKKQLLVLAFAASAFAGAAASEFVTQAFDGPVIKGTIGHKAPSRADETPSLDFTYAGEPYTAYTLGLAQGSDVYLAFEFTPEMATAYAGNTITAFNATTGVYNSNGRYLNRINDITVFITEDLYGDPVCSQAGILGSSGFTQYTIDLETPYTIEAGKGFYMGYTFKTTEAPSTGREFYICVDDNASADPAGSWIGIISNGQKVWEQLADQLGGALCMGCRIVGESLPVNGVDVSYVSGTDFVEPGVEFSYELGIRGIGANAPESIEVVCTIGSDEPKTVELPVSGGIAYGEDKTVSLTGLLYDKEQLGTPIRFEVSKVNGVDNFSGRRTGESSFNCFPRSRGFDRMHLVEEATGTWCQWCPRGIVMMEYIKTQYPGKFAGIAIHDSDAMAATSCTAITDALAIPGYPYMVIDRIIGDDPGYTQYFDDIAANDYPAIVGISSLEATVNEEEILTIDTKIQFVFDTDNSANRYRLAYYLTEDGVGPYRQTNAYAGGTYGAMGGWESKAASALTYYDEVARLQLGGINGYSRSIPSEIIAGEEYAYSVTSALSAIKNNKFVVTAFIVDTQTGEIVNAAQTEAENPYYASITGIEAVKAEGGEWYDLHGRRVASPTSGLYILRNGSSASRILVK